MDPSSPHLAAVDEVARKPEIKDVSARVLDLSTDHLSLSITHELDVPHSELHASALQIPDQYKALFNTIIRQNEALKEQNQLLTDRVGSLTEKIETLEPSEPIFHPFTRLPRELRDMIWKLASDQGRFVIIRVLTPLNPDGATGLTTRLQSHPEGVPAVLHTSQESRQQAERSYSLCVEPGAMGKSRYFNHTHDILYYDLRYFIKSHIIRFDPIKWFFPEHQGFSAADVSRLALDTRTWNIFRQMVIIEMHMHPNLKELILLEHFMPNFYDSFVCPQGKLIVKDVPDTFLVDRFIPVTNTVSTPPRLNPIEKGEYEKDVCENFKKELLHPAKRRPTVRNPWLRDGKILPDVKVMEVSHVQQSPSPGDYHLFQTIENEDVHDSLST